MVITYFEKIRTWMKHGATTPAVVLWKLAINNIINLKWEKTNKKYKKSTKLRKFWRFYWWYGRIHNNGKRAAVASRLAFSNSGAPPALIKREFLFCFYIFLFISHEFCVSLLFSVSKCNSPSLLLCWSLLVTILHYNLWMFYSNFLIAFFSQSGYASERPASSQQAQLTWVRIGFV